MKKIFLVLQIVFFLTFVSCSSLKTEKCLVQGIVYDGNNEPVSGVCVYNSSRPNSPIAVSDIKGHFAIYDYDGISNSSLLLSKKGFEKKTVSLDDFFSSVTVCVQIYSAENIASRYYENLKCNNYSELETIENRFLSIEKRSEEVNNQFNFLKSIYLYRIEDYEESKKLLSKISFTNSYVKSLSKKIDERNGEDKI